MSSTLSHTIHDTPRDWTIGRIPNSTLQWGAIRNGHPHSCRYCGLLLLTGEDAGFCCGPGGNRLHTFTPLPPLPLEIARLTNDPHISAASNTLNLIFSFASLESTGDFATFPQGPPAFFALAGRVYHRLRPDHPDSAIHWLLYDGFDLAHPPHSTYASRLPSHWLAAVKQALLRVNPFAQQLRMLGDLDPNTYPTVSVTLTDAPQCKEIAAIMRYSNTAQADVRPRSMVVFRKDNRNTTIPVISRLWEPLAYPLFFPHGTLGWGLAPTSDELADIIAPPGTQSGDPETTQIWSYRGRLLHEPRFSQFGRLGNEYVVDMFSRNLESRMNYIRANQRKLQVEDAMAMGLDDVEANDNIYLPASFLGSNRWASEQIADSLAIAATSGPPTFFITFTCNTSWPEIVSQVQPYHEFRDYPVVVCRVFKRKLALLEQALQHMFPHAAPLLYIIHAVEFQKRGAPHAHLLVKYNIDLSSPSDIDSIISAEMPSDPADVELIYRCGLIHHCGPYCGYCRFHYPQPLQATTTFDAAGRVHYRRRHERDRFVVPHNLALVREFGCHINFEAADTSHMFQYMFKYIHKGPDHAKFNLFVHDPHSTQHTDEIQEYWDGRYLSATEATWRILGFHLTKKQPSVTALPIHLPSSSHIHRQYERADHSNLHSLSLLEHYFHRPTDLFIDHDGNQRSFASLTYAEYFSLFRLAPRTPASHVQTFAESDVPHGASPTTIVLRQSRHTHLARLHSARPSEGERFYLRAILQHRAVRSFEDALVVDDVRYDCYQDAANALGLFAMHNEGELALTEAITTLSTPFQLRVLFVHLLVNDCIASPRHLWDSHRAALSLDFTIRHNGIQTFGENDTLDHINHLLEEYGVNLATYGLPEPCTRSSEVFHELERWSALRPQLTAQANDMIAALNVEQRQIFDIIDNAVQSARPYATFIDGPAGRGKTFLVNALCAHLRGQGRIVLATATSAYAAQLYPGGRTAHSTFKVGSILHYSLYRLLKIVQIPVNEHNELIQSTISPHSSRADLIRESDAILWDEAPMVNRAVPGAVDDLLRLLMNSPLPFGGKVIIFLGDFRQTCPVVRGGSRAQVIDASFRSSPLWSSLTIHHLSIPVRNAEDPEFAAFVDAIGNGAGPQVSLDLLQRVNDSYGLVSFVYPQSIIERPCDCLYRAILAPTNAQIDRYNDTIIDAVPGSSHTYYAADSLKEAEEAGLEATSSILDYAARQSPPGMPPYMLPVKINAVYRLVRNLSVDRALTKNTRVVVVALGRRLITVRILRASGGVTAPDVSEDILIPRITFSQVLSSGHTLLRHQFPLAPAYATTFNSCQGLTLDTVGVDLTRPVFSHGQLYTALSRIRHRRYARVCLPVGETTTTNVVYKEILL